MERLISLDLGLTTGYAVLDIESNIVEHGVLLEDTLSEGLQDLIRKHTFSYAVVEKPVIFRGELGDKLTEVIFTTNHFFPASTARWVGPDAWKPTPYGQAEVPKGITTHERDAIRMGLWFIAWLKRS